MQYGMTISPQMPWLMGAVLKNIELRGSTMGSRREFAQMVEFVRNMGLKPVVSRVVNGGSELQNMEEMNNIYEDMKNASQFGKLVIKIKEGGESSKL